MRRRWQILGLVGGLAGATPAVARKTNQAVYEDPFDLGAGGASLTRASKDGRIFANPALMPQGGGLFRWLGSTISVLANKESVGTAQSILKKAQGGGETASEAEQAAETAAFIDKVFKDPVRVGWGFSLALVTSNFGVSVFSRFEPDIRARAYGATGLPEVRFEAESYHGVGVGTAIRTPWKALSLGVTGKYLYAAEPTLAVEISDTESIAAFQDQDLVQDLTSHNTGVGFDAGAVLLLQGNYVDFSVAAKADDLGNTALKGPAESPTEFKQVQSAGVGLTLHTGSDAIHMAVDYRDIGDSYGEELFKKVYAGTKVLIRTYVGVSAGYYNGYPSYGAEIDLILVRLAGTAYTRELGDHPGADPRRIYMFSLSAGF